jgi:hypothetical protein
MPSAPAYAPHGLERGQQLGIESGKPGQVLGVYLVGFALVLVDQAQLTSVGHQHLVSTLFQKPTDPGRVGSHFDGDTHGLATLETLPESLGRGAQAALFDHVASVGVDEAQVALCLSPRSSPAVIFGILLVLSFLVMGRSSPFLLGL